jgi:NitT/TauT family transport system permease protein
MIFVTLGLGQLLVMGRDLNDINEVVAVMLLIVAIGLLTDAAFFRILERSANGDWLRRPKIRITSLSRNGANKK